MFVFLIHTKKTVTLETIIQQILTRKIDKQINFLKKKNARKKRNEKI